VSLKLFNTFLLPQLSKKHDKKNNVNIYFSQSIISSSKMYVIILGRGPEVPEGLRGGRKYRNGSDTPVSDNTITGIG
jgi:hypothetical protein